MKSLGGESSDYKLFKGGIFDSQAPVAIAIAVILLQSLHQGKGGSKTSDQYFENGYERFRVVIG